MDKKGRVEAFTQTLKAHAKNIGSYTKSTETNRKTVLVNIIYCFMHYCEDHHIDHKEIIESAERWMSLERGKQTEEDKKNALVWLQGDEEEGVLPCGCKLVLLGDDHAFVVCEKHKKIYREG